MNNTLTIMVGLPASGKDFLIKNNIDNALILSSDNLRVELYGYEDQTHNKEVFEEMNRRTRNTGKENKNVIYNATNINRGRRVTLAQEMQKYFKYIKVIVCVCSIKTLLYRNKTRKERHLPEDKLKQMIRSFQIPTLYEYHYDDIEYVWTETKRRGFERDKIALLMDYDQHNKHHSENLGIHILRTADYCKENGKAYKAAIYHDLGKPFCKTTDEEGFNHFIGHPNVSAYLEPFHTPYFIGDIYLKCLFSYIPTNQMSLLGGMYEKQKAFLHEYPSKKKEFSKFGCDPKQYHHVVRLYDIIKYAENKDILNFPFLRYSGERAEYMKKIKRGLNGLTIEQIQKDIETKIEEAKAILDNKHYKFQEANLEEEIGFYLKQKIKEALLNE